jgi:chemotaxis protein methyltransferase CheR
LNQSTAPDLERFAAEVLSELGYRLDNDNAAQMGQVLRNRLEQTGCATYAAYKARLSDPGVARKELREVALQVTVPETYFFRHPEHFQALAEAALPERARVKGAKGQLTLVSAGCASGEEAYSMAATVLATPEVRGFDVKIWGVDVNPELLQKGGRACYSAWALRALNEPERSRLFRREGRNFILEPHLRALVLFEERNLLERDESFWKPGFFDVVFCRNVMIYFSAAAVRAVVAALAECLAPGGFLFLGPSETLRGISHEFHLRHTHGAFYYQRRLAGEKPAPGVPRTAPRSSAGAGAPVPVSSDPGWVSTIAGAAERIAALAGGPRTASRERGPTARPAPLQGGAFPAALDMSEVHSLLRQERFEEALEAIDGLPGSLADVPSTLMLQAVLRLNCGQLERAEQVCRLLSAEVELRPEAHYLMAVCQEKRGEHLAAAEHDQAAIYLAPGFAMPRLHLGLLARRLGDLRTARRELNEALNLLSSEDASRILLFGGGFSRESLVGFCRAQLELCGSGHD